MANPKKLLQFSEITFVLNTFKPDKTNLRQNCPTLGAHTFHPIISFHNFENFKKFFLT